MSLPAPIPPAEFAGTLTRPRAFNGAFLIPKEDWEEACKHDPYLLKILDYIQQDRAYIAVINHRIAEAHRPIRKMRSKIHSVRHRIEARKRQYKHFADLLRKNLAYEKMKKLRKDIGLT